MLSRLLHRYATNAMTRRWIDRHATHILGVSGWALRCTWGPDWQADPRCQVVYDALPPAMFEAEARPRGRSARVRPAARRSLDPPRGTHGRAEESRPRGFDLRRDAPAPAVGPTAVGRPHVGQPGRPHDLPTGLPPHRRIGHRRSGDLRRAASTTSPGWSRRPICCCSLRSGKVWATWCSRPGPRAPPCWRAICRASAKSPSGCPGCIAFRWRRPTRNGPNRRPRWRPIRRRTRIVWRPWSFSANSEFTVERCAAALCRIWRSGGADAPNPAAGGVADG